MKTSLDLQQELYRAVKVKAAQDGRTISDLVSEGIRLVLKMPDEREPRRVQFPLIAADPKRPVLTQKQVAEAEAAMLAEEASRLGSSVRR